MRTYFLFDAPRATGRSFSLNLIFAEVQMQHELALTEAFSWIAAGLSDGRRRAHSAPKLLLKLNLAAYPLCNIVATSRIATTNKL